MPSHASTGTAVASSCGQAPLTTTSTVRELTRLLHQHGDRILEEKALLSLTTESLAVLNNGFDAIRESPEDKSFDVLPTNHSPLTVLPELQFIHDFVQKTPSLRLAHGNNTIQGCINLQTFRSLRHLELRRVPMHLLHGLQRVRPQLVVLSAERCLHQLQDMFESMPPDETAVSLSWSSLEKAYLPYNFIEHLDGSLRLLPMLKVLDVSHNCLKTSDDYLAYLTELVHLNLSYNSLSAVPHLSMSSRTRLRTLVLANNHIDNLAGLQGLEALEILDLSNNLLCDHSDLAPLSRLTLLKELYLALNPLTFHKKHRIRTAAFVSAVALRTVRLDGVPFSATELIRTRTVAVIRRPLSTVGRRSLVSGSRANLLDNSEAADNHYGSIAGGAERDALDSLTVSMQSRNSVRRIRSIQISDLDDTGDADGIGGATSGSGTTDEDEAKSAAAAARSMRSAAVQNEIASARREMEQLRRQLGDTWLTSLAVTSTPTPRPQAAETAHPVAAVATKTAAATAANLSDWPAETQMPKSGATAASSLPRHLQQPPQLQAPQQTAAAAASAGAASVVTVPQPIALARSPLPSSPPSSSAYASLNLSSVSVASQSAPNRFPASTGTTLLLAAPATGSMASSKAPAATLLSSSPIAAVPSTAAPPLSTATSLVRSTAADSSGADAGDRIALSTLDSARPSRSAAVVGGGGGSNGGGIGSGSDFAGSSSRQVAKNVAACTAADDDSATAGTSAAAGEPPCDKSNRTEPVGPAITGVHSNGYEDDDGDANIVWKDVVEDEDADGAGDELFIVYPVHARPPSSSGAASVAVLSAEPCFVLLGGHYLYEKDHNGHVSDKLDLRMLLSAGITSEVYKEHTVVNLQFDYVRKDRRERSYAMESVRSAEHLMALLSPVLKLRQKSAASAAGLELQCLRCNHVFKKESAILKVLHKASGNATKANAVSEVLHCPSCGSPQVVRHEADHSVDDCVSAVSAGPTSSGHRRTGSDGSLPPTAGSSTSPADRANSSLLSFEPAVTSSRLPTPERPSVAALPWAGAGSSSTQMHRASLKRRLAASAGGTPLYGSLCNVSESTSYYSVMDAGGGSTVAGGSAAASSFHSVDDIAARLRAASEPRHANGGGGGPSGSSSGWGSQETITSTDPDARRAAFCSPRAGTPESDVPAAAADPRDASRLPPCDSTTRHDERRGSCSSSGVGISAAAGATAAAAADDDGDDDDAVVVEPCSQLTFRFDDFAAVDHRLKLFLAMEHFADDDETCECVLLSHVVQHNTALHFVGILAVSTVAVYVLKIRRHHLRLSPNAGSAAASSTTEPDVASSVVLVERQPLVDLCYVDIALSHQNFRLEFERSGYCFLVRDEQRSKKFVTMLTALVRRVAFDANCRLKAITKLHGEYLECFNKWVRTDEDVDVASGDADPGDAAVDEEHSAVAAEPYYCMALLCSSDSAAAKSIASCSHPFADSALAESLEPVSLFLTGSVVYVLKENCCLPLSRCSTESVKKSYFSQHFTIKISDVSQVNLFADLPRDVELETFKEGSSSTNLPLQNQSRFMFATVQAARTFVGELGVRWRAMFGVELSVETRAVDR